MTLADASAPSLAIVIVNYRTSALVIDCVQSLVAERAAVGPFDVFVVDGNSGDGSAETLAAHFADPAFRDWVTLLPLDFNGGFGWANNQAMLRLLQRPVPPEFIHILNPDTVVEPGAIAALLEVARGNARIGAVASQLLEPDGALAGSAFRFPSARREFLRGCDLPKLGKLLRVEHTVIDSGVPVRAQWLTGASVLFRSAALRETGLFDDGFFLYFEEVELMHRLYRAGWEAWLAPASRVVHIAGAATGVASGAQVARKPHPPYRYEARRRFFMRTGGTLGLILANAGWLTGWAIARLLSPLRPDRGVATPRELPMTLRYCFWPSLRDYRASIPAWDEPPGRRPAWSVE